MDIYSLTVWKTVSNTDLGNFDVRKMRIDVAKCINVLQNAFVNLPSLAFMLPKLLSENPASFLGVPRIYIEN